MSDLLAVAAVLCTGVVGVTAPVWWAHRGPDLVLRFHAWRAQARVARLHGRYLRLITTGRRTRLTARALHNDFDADCVHFWGDRNPEPNDVVNRDYGGSPTRFDARRCVVCRPYVEEESAPLLDPAAGAADGGTR